MSAARRTYRAQWKEELFVFFVCAQKCSHSFTTFWLNHWTVLRMRMFLFIKCLLIKTKSIFAIRLGFWSLTILCSSHFVFLSFYRLHLERNSSAQSVQQLMGCPWTRHTWWRGTVYMDFLLLASEMHCGFFQHWLIVAQEILSCALRSRLSNSLDLKNCSFSKNCDFPLCQRLTAYH